MMKTQSKIMKLTFEDFMLILLIIWVLFMVFMLMWVCISSLPAGTTSWWWDPVSPTIIGVSVKYAS